MRISEREKKLLIILVILSILFLAIGVGLPKIESISILKDDIESKQNELTSAEFELVQMKDEVDKSQEELEDIKEYLIETTSGDDGVKFYKNITDGEIVVEINKFIPVSKKDKFLINEIYFVDNDELYKLYASIANGTYSESEVITERNSDAENNTSTDNNENAENTENTENTDDTENIESPDKSTTDTETDVEELDSIDKLINSIPDFGYLENVAEVSFEGYFESLVGFIESVNNNDRYVEVVAVIIYNGALADPTVEGGTITGKVILSFPTREGYESNSDIYAILNDQYNTTTSDPFDPFDSFVIVDTPVEGGSVGTSVTFKKLENFSKNPYFFVTNDDRNSGYIATSQKSTDGNASLKIYYDFYNRNNKNEVYAVSERENIILENTPREMSIDIFNDSANENQFGVVFRDATGREIDTIVSPNLGFNGWSTEYIPLPENAVYPVVIQRFYVRSGGSGVKQEGTILIDNLQVLEY